MSKYHVHRVKIGQTPQLDELARECGRLYSQTVASFWRTVRHKGLWLKPKHLMRWHTSPNLHAHTADACVQAFFASLQSWRERKKAGDPDAKPPRKRKRYFRIEYKRSAMRLADGTLRLSNGKRNPPLVLPGPGNCRRRSSSTGRETSMRRSPPMSRRRRPPHQATRSRASTWVKSIWRSPTMGKTRTSSTGGSYAPKYSTATSCRRNSTPASMDA